MQVFHTKEELEASMEELTQKMEREDILCGIEIQSINVYWKNDSGEEVLSKNCKIRIRFQGRDIREVKKVWFKEVVDPIKIESIIDLDSGVNIDPSKLTRTISLRGGHLK